MYKRFTEKRKGKNVIPLFNSVCGVDLPKWTLAEESNIRRYLSGDAVDKLAELEDKIENVTLIERPPVKKGDSIWLIRAKRDYLDGRYRKIVWRCVDKIFLNNDNTYTISTISVSSGGYKNRSIVKSTTFKKSWFLTKAEAEAKLKKLQK